MERGLATYLYEQTLYDGRMYSLIHHLEFEWGGGWWGAALMCNGLKVAGGEINKTIWNDQPFLLKRMVTCLTCIVEAGRRSL